MNGLYAKRCLTQRYLATLHVCKQPWPFRQKVKSIKKHQISWINLDLQSFRQKDIMEGVHKIVWLMIVVNFVSLLYTIHFLVENFSTIKMSSTRLAGKKVTHCLYIPHSLCCMCTVHTVHLVVCKYVLIQCVLNYIIPARYLKAMIFHIN